MVWAQKSNERAMKQKEFDVADNWQEKMKIIYEC